MTFLDALIDVSDVTCHDIAKLADIAAGADERRLAEFLIRLAYHVAYCSEAGRAVRRKRAREGIDAPPKETPLVADVVL